MSENKTGKYFKYAIGEIVLVVIGILIALQINNWNEGRKDDLFERKILTEIKTSLEKDLGRTEMLLKYRAKNKARAISNLVKSLALEDKINDSTLTREFFKAGNTLSWSFDKGPFESLKSSGLNKIKNDSLRSILVRFYEVGLPLTNIFIDYNKGLYAERRYMLRDHLFSYKFQQQDTVWSIKRVINFDSIKTRVELKQLLQMEKTMADNYINRLENVIDDIKYVLSALEKELN